MAPNVSVRPPIMATERDAAALAWVERRCAALVVEIRRRRKTRPPGPLSAEEMAALSVIMDTEIAVRRLRLFVGGEHRRTTEVHETGEKRATRS